MMRNRFDQQLEQLHADLITMGGLCETAIAAAVDAATKGDGDMAKAAIADDSKIDEMERSIEHLCLKLLLQQQPVARDLRTISSALKMISDMARIGDQAWITGSVLMISDGRISFTRLLSLASNPIFFISSDSKVQRKLSMAIIRMLYMPAALRMYSASSLGWMLTSSTADTSPCFAHSLQGALIRARVLACRQIHA